MGIFHEFFPVAKASIPDHAKSLEKAELCKLGGGDVGSESFIGESSKLLPKPGLTEKVREIVEGTHQQINQSKIIEQQLSRVHRMIEKIDEINFIIEPSYEFYDVDPLRFRVAACESILSMEPKNQEDKKKTTAAAPSTPKPVPKASPRVDLKSNRKLPLPAKVLTKTVSMPVLSSSKPISDSMSTLAVPKKFSRCFQKVPSFEVQEILKAAKEKRVSNRSEIKIPVVELKLCK